MNVQNWMIEWFIKNGNNERQMIEDNLNNNYVEVGLVDSFGFIQLIADVEEEFKISFNDSDFVDEKLFTIQGMCERVLERAKNE